MKFIQSVDLRQIDGLQFVIGTGHCVPSPKPCVRIAHPQYTSTYLVLIGCNRRNANTNASCRILGRLAGQGEHRHPGTIESKLVDIGRISNRGDVKVASFQWI